MGVSEVISAVVDDEFFGEEDDDYEDLYNDVNVGENVLQSLRKDVEGLTLSQAHVVENNKDEITQVAEERKFERVEEVVLSKCTETSEVEWCLVNLSLRSPSGSESIGRGEGVVQVESEQSPNSIGNMEEQVVTNNGQNIESVPQNHALNAGNTGLVGSGQHGRGGSGGGSGAILFVGDLHWWTTDAELENELSKYGPVKEVKLFDERASGRSKGYCQVEFYNPASASSCKDGMNGHLFNGRPCTVAFASPLSVKKMGETQVYTNTRGGQTNMNQERRPPGDAVGKPVGTNITTGPNNQAGPENNRGFGRGNWGRNTYLQSLPEMRNRGFHGAFKFNQPFPGMMSGFPRVGMPGGEAPRVHPDFFGRGMGMNGVGMMPTPGMNAPNMGMWLDPTMGGWACGGHAGRVGESGHGENGVSDHQYGESHDGGTRQSVLKEKDRGSGSSERRYRDDRDTHREKYGRHDHDWSERRPRDERDVGKDGKRVRDRSNDPDRNRDHHKDERGRYLEHHNRYREGGSEYDDEWERGRSSMNHYKSRISNDEERSRDAD